MQITLYTAETSAAIMGFGGYPNLSKKRKTRDRSRAFQNNSEQLRQMFDNDLSCSAFVSGFYQTTVNIHIKY